MKITAGYDDAIQFSGFGSACTITEYGQPKKPKRRKAKVGFVSMARLKADNAQRKEGR